MTWLREVAITFILSQRNKKKISIQWFYTPRCDRKNEKKKTYWKCTPSSCNSKWPHKKEIKKKPITIELSVICRSMIFLDKLSFYEMSLYYILSHDTVF